MYDKSTQEKIDLVSDACAAVTDCFRKSLQPAKDNEGNRQISIGGVELLLVDISTLSQYLADFEKALRNTVSNFSLPKHERPLDLSYISFSNEVNFFNTNIRSVNFTGSVFQRGAIFNGAVFQSTADFSRTKFINGHCMFENTTFMGNVSFKDAHLPHADFNGARFKYPAVDFENAVIEKGASFDKAIFDGSAIFKNTDFSGDTSFSGCQFQRVDFSESRFNGIANFNNAVFSSRAIYHLTTFFKAPWFHEASLHQDTSFYNCNFFSFESVEDWRAYRTMKLLMGQFRAHEEEGRFFEYEQRARRNILLNENCCSLVGNLSKLYDILSKYGESISRPIAWLFFNTTYFVLLYYLKGGIRVNPDISYEWPENILPSIGLSLQNSFTPLSLFNKAPTYLVDNVFVAALSTAQSLITLILVTLLILAIRRRFHKSGGQ